MGKDAQQTKAEWHPAEWPLLPCQVSLLAELQERTVVEAARARGIGRHAVRRRVLVAAEQLEAQGLDATCVRTLLRRRRGRTIPISGLSPAEQGQAARLLGEAELSPAQVSRARTRASFGARRRHSRRRSA